MNEDNADLSTPLTREEYMVMDAVGCTLARSNIASERLGFRFLRDVLVCLRANVADAETVDRELIADYTGIPADHALALMARAAFGYAQYAAIQEFLESTLETHGNGSKRGGEARKE